MTRRAMFIMVAVALVSTAIAAPHRKAPKKGAGTGSGSAIGSASGSGSGSGPVSGSGSGSGPVSGSGPASGSTTGSSAPGNATAGSTATNTAAPGLSPVTLPAKAPTLAMRPRAHDGFVDNMDCSACHTSDGWELAAVAGKSGFDHDRTGFALRGAHVQTDCGGCHTSVAKPASACEGCHRDPHQGKTNGPCAECHTATAWTDTNTLEQHRRTRMPLTGRHATVDCVACHKRQGERQWSNVPLDCYGCHRAEYHGNTHPIHDGKSGDPIVSRECGLCHQTSAWSPATCSAAITPCPNPARSVARTVDHDGWFVLTTGSHRTADCASCHSDARRMKAVRCDGCHMDVALRQQHRGAAIARGATSCLRCHPRGAAR